jgi:hypothetical protein
MRIYGLDFTSAPRSTKPITCSVCNFDGAVLTVTGFCDIISFEEFDRFLNHDGPWVAGIDFPFGQPRKLIENLVWPNYWEGYVDYVGRMSKEKFEESLRNYSDPESGKRRLLRETDRRAGSRSPMQLDFTPVGKMFFRGAPHLLKCCASILPCQPRSDDRIVLETYPALVARRWLGNDSYKSDQRGKQTPKQREMRSKIINNLHSRLTEFYGLDIRLSHQDIHVMLDDPSADYLDAVLCAVQTAWAYAHRVEGYGIPDAADCLEGWIVDPEVLKNKT